MIVKTKTIFIYAGLIFVYIAIRLPDILVLREFASASFALISLYISRSLLFLNNGLNPEFAKTIVCPANAFFIYPPGLYFLSQILGNVRNMFIFLFLIQLTVPVLIFELLRRIASFFIAMLCAFLSIYYMTNCNWWVPDWIIQPIMLSAILLLWRKRSSGTNWSRLKLILAAVLAGVIAILKHNIGVFFIIVCATLILFRSMQSHENRNGCKRHATLICLIAGYFTFGFIFLSKVIYFDEIIFYLFPYFVFWALFLYFVMTNKSLVFDVKNYVKEMIIFIPTALLIPGIMFWLIGDVVGYSRYWHSLFGMGLQCLPIWDYGIVSMLKQSLSGLGNIRNVKSNYLTLIKSALFIFPFIVNCCVIGKIFYCMKKRSVSSTDIRKYFEVGSMSIMSMFMFFPLEGYHILATKLFIFCFVLVYFIRSFFGKVSVFLKLVLILMFIPVVLSVFIKPVRMFERPTSSGSEILRNTIAMPMEKRLSEELDKQIEVIERSVRGRKYYTISTSPHLMALVNNNCPQYYLLIGKYFWNQDVANSIIDTVRRLPFVIVGQKDYNKYLLGQDDDPLMWKIMDFIRNNFTIIDRYNASPDKSTSINQAYSFNVMRTTRE